MMTDPDVDKSGNAAAPGRRREAGPPCAPATTHPSSPDDYADFEPSPEPAAQADRRNVRSKLAAGWRGLKSAVRGDSSFFAHCYRGTLIAITAALLGINQRGWCLLVLGACLVLIAELAHSAVDTLARAIGDPEEPASRRLARSPPPACSSPPSAPAPSRSWC